MRECTTFPMWQGWHWIVRTRLSIYAFWMLAAVVQAQEGIEELRERLDQQALQIQQLQEELNRLREPGGPMSATPMEDGYLQVGSDPSMTGQWRHGLHMVTRDGAFRIHPTGRLQFDMVWIDGQDNVEFGANGVGDALDGVAFRRFRVGVEGQFWEVCNFHFQPDLLNTVNTLAPNGSQQTTTVVVPIDNWVEVTQIPLVGTVRVGSLKPEYLVEHLTSSNDLDFMERSLLFDAFVGGLDNGFQPGFDIYNTYFGDRLRIANTITKNNQSLFGFNQGEGEFSWVIRVSGLLVDAFEGRCLLHVGASYNRKDLDDDRYRFRGRTTVRNGPAALQTTLADLTVFGDSIDMVIPEVVLIAGPLSVVAEYAAVWTNNVNRADLGFGLGTITFPSNTLFFQGFHVDVMYFLTGEHRPYNRLMHFLDRPVPLEPFFLVRGDNGLLAGRGAWQIGVRYSQIDFNDSGVFGGRVHDTTLGLNWYLNPNLKFQWNVTINKREIPGIESNGFVYGAGMRTALQF